MTGWGGLLLAGSVLASACGGPQEAAPVPEEAPEPAPVIAPADFVLLPCGDMVSDPCALVMAGGKRLLFGAPAGISAALEAEDLAALDAAFLFSLHPRDVEGLDEVRNRGWRAGRPEALPVSGPQGIEALVEGLNLAYEQPDALSFVEEGAPAGGFDAALLSHATTIESDALVFDSGDLKVQAAEGGTSNVSYRVGYRDLDEVWHEVLLTPCKGAEVGPGDYEVSPENRQAVVCENADASTAWPLHERVFIFKSDA